MANVLILGAGGVGRVVTHKCAAVPQVFEKIILASRTLSKCREIQSEIKHPIQTAQADAENPRQLAELIKKNKIDLVIHVALPYQDLSVMEACLEGGANYVDTANYESLDNPRFEYKLQWAFHERFAQKKLTALLGSGFDPGVTNVFCQHAAKHHFDEIHTIDIFDCNAGEHGFSFATNFNPEINIREITQAGRYWEKGEWIEVEPMSVHFPWDYPEIGPRESYLLYHEELESLVKNIPKLRRIRFFMTFGEEYLNHLRVLQNVGMTSIHPVQYKGSEIVPLQFLKTMLPDPASLAKNYTGKTCIGNVIEGIKDGRKKKIYIYNICDHQKAYKDTYSQAISYTTGVPAMIGAMLILQGKWKRAGVYNAEEFDSDPFMELLPRYGLPYREKRL